MRTGVGTTVRVCFRALEPAKRIRYRRIGLLLWLVLAADILNSDSKKRGPWTAWPDCFGGYRLNRGLGLFGPDPIQWTGSLSRSALG